ncbi:MFS transporter [Thermodesulfobacteriota bacterium]
MDEETTAEKGIIEERRIKKGSYLILGCFFVAHGIFHFMSHSFSVMLPAVKNTFVINPIQVGAIITAKELSAGLAALPGGVMSDYLRRHRALLMSICMIVFSIGWLVIGLSPFYKFLVLGMVIIAVAGSIWHLPSLAELGLLFAHNRGVALAIHGAGGSIGDILGPVITGLLLSAMSWRNIISLYAVVPLGTAFWVYWALLRLGNKKFDEKESGPEKKIDLRTQLIIARKILKRTHIWRVNLVAGFRGMCFVVLVNFLPLFMKEELGHSSKYIGFHFGLLWTVGIIASPMMGHLSDLWGRKPVLVPALLYSSLLIILLSFAGKGALFTVMIALLGISIRSDYSLVSATILDIAGNQVVTTMLGILSLTRFSMGAVSPLIAGALYQYAGMQATLFYVAALFVASAIIFSFVDLNLKAPVEPEA